MFDCVSYVIDHYVQFKFQLSNDDNDSLSSERKTFDCGVLSSPTCNMYAYDSYNGSTENESPAVIKMNIRMCANSSGML